MEEHIILDKAYHAIMKRMVATGHAPHFTELASELGISIEETRKALHDLFDAGIVGVIYPKTEHIISCFPLNNFPTNYRITIDGQQKWYAHWGFESLAVCWLFPGKRVTVDFSCLDCSKPLQVVQQDGRLLNKEEASGYVAYVSVPSWKWLEDVCYSWSTMNLFRSEEHVLHSAYFVEGTEEGIVPLLDLIKLFSGPYMTRRMDPDYFSNVMEYTKEFVPVLKEINKTGPFWRRPKSWLYRVACVDADLGNDESG